MIPFKWHQITQSFTLHFILSSQSQIAHMNINNERLFSINSSLCVACTTTTTNSSPSVILAYYCTESERHNWTWIRIVNITMTINLRIPRENIKWNSRYQQSVFTVQWAGCHCECETIWAWGISSQLYLTYTHEPLIMRIL